MELNSEMRAVYIAGSINMDIVAHAPRHPIAGETIAGTSLSYFPGGKGANQAVAAAQMGASTRMVGMLGDDAFAGSLRDFLVEMKVDLTHVSVAEETPSGTALIVVGGAENTIVVVPGANGVLAPKDLDGLSVDRGDVLVAQFETPAETTRDFFERGRAAGATTILNPAPAAPINPRLLELCDIVVVNETEFAFLGGSHVEITLEDPSAIAAAVGNVRSSDDQVWVLTLGAAGVAAVDGSETDAFTIPGHQVEAVDTTGAGDCFVGSLAAALAEGNSLIESLLSSNAAAALCVQAHGAGPSMPRRSQVEAFIKRT